MSVDQGDQPSAELAETVSLEPPLRDTHQAGIKRMQSGSADEAPRIGRFSLLKVLGEGGMGTVYAAYDDRLDRRIALKLVKGDGNDESRPRMLREAQAMAKLSHPNVVPIFDVGEHDGHLYLAMEFVKGRTLARWQREREPPFSVILQKYLEAGRGLAAAHAEGIVHRDFKPHNAIIGTDGRVRVLDFGLAGTHGEQRLTQPHSTQLPAPVQGGFATPLTQTGAVMGTPAYMSPEQAVGDEVDHRSDQFSFCVALWEAVYGSRPFQGQSTVEVFTAAAKGDFSEPDDRDVPTWLRSVLERGLRSKPGDRWPDMQKLLEQLSPPPQAPLRPRRWPMLTAIGVLVASLVGLGWQRNQQCSDVEAELDDTWNPTRRQALREEIAALEVEGAADTARQVDRALDAYARAWRAERRALCEASHRGPSHLELLRLACLENRHQALDALIGALEQPTAARVATAVDAVARLPTIRSCHDDAYVAANMAVPEDANRRAEVEAIRDELAQIAIVEFVDENSAEQIARLVALDQRAAAVQFPPVRLEVLNRLTWVYWFLDDTERAHEAADTAYTLVGSANATAESLSLRAMLYVRAGDQHHAILASRRALSVLETSSDRDSIGPYYARLALAQALLEQGDTDEALEQLRLTRQLLIDRVGEHHPGVRAIRTMELNAVRDYDQWVTDALRRVERAKRADPPDPDALASALLELSMAQMLTGDLEELVPNVEQALALIDDKPPDDPARIQAASIIAYRLLMRGEYARALRSAHEALAALDTPPPFTTTQHILVLEEVKAMALAELGRAQEALAAPNVMIRSMPPVIKNRFKSTSIAKAPALLALGHYRQAADAVDRFVGALSQRMGGKPIWFAVFHAQIGYARMGLGQYENALSALGDAEDAVPDSLPEHPLLASIAHFRGLVHWMRGEHATASNHLHDALERSVMFAPPTSPNIALIRACIAAVQWTTGPKDEALSAMHDATTMYREALGADTPAVARGWGLLALMAHAQGDRVTVDRAQAALDELERVHPNNETITGVRALLDVAIADRRAAPARIVAAADTAHARGLLLLARLAKDINGS